MSEWLASTMLIERLTGVTLYAGMLLVFFALLRKAKDYKSVNKYLNIYLVVLTIMGFFYIPGETADLYRWLLISEEWVGLSFVEFLKTWALKMPTPVAYIIMYVCTSTSIKGLLPAVCSFIFHYNIFAIVKSLYKHECYTNKEIAYTLLLVMSMGRFLEAISGVRCLVGLSILANCFCKEFLSSEKLKTFARNIPLALIACFMHLLAFALYAFRIIFLLLESETAVKYNWLVKAGIVALCVIGGIICHEYIIMIFEKAGSYLFGEKYYYIWEYIIAGMIYVLMTFVLYNVYKYNKMKQIKKYNDLIIFNLTLFILELATCFQYSMFHRLVTFSCVMMMPLVAYYLKIAGNEKKGNIILAVALVVLFVACVRGDLCAYKFFLLH